MLGQCEICAAIVPRTYHISYAPDIADQLNHFKMFHSQCPDSSWNNISLDTLNIIDQVRTMYVQIH